MKSALVISMVCLWALSAYLVGSAHQRVSEGNADEDIKYRHTVSFSILISVFIYVAIGILVYKFSELH